MSSILSRRALITGGVAAFATAASSQQTLILPGMEPPPADLSPSISSKVPVRLALAFDASGSIDMQEFNLQLSGTADALQSDEVKAAVRKVGAVAICGTQFSSSASQTLPHALLRTDDEVDQYADLIRYQERHSSSQTGLANGISSTVKLLSESPYAARKSVIDVSGDGVQNINPPTIAGQPQFEWFQEADREGLDAMVRSATSMAAYSYETTVNGLAICRDIRSLDQYFNDNVVTSEQTWDLTGVDKGRTWAVNSFADIKTAMISKLATEMTASKTPLNAPNSNGQIIRFG